MPAAASATSLADAVSAWIEALGERQRAVACFRFDDERERTDWAYYPRDHKGVPLHDMDARQQKLAHSIVSTALSLPAYAQTCAIIALESVLDVLEGRRGSQLRDSGRYFTSVFGLPGDARWGWRFEGHHVCLNVTVVEGEVAATPLFLGANPASVTIGPHAVSRPCGAEEDAARALLELLDDSQRSVAIVSDTAPPDFVLANVPLVPDRLGAGAWLPPLRPIRDSWDALPEGKRKAVGWDIARPAGLAPSRMTPRQASLLRELVEIYVDRLPEPLAAPERERVGGDVHFAWAGSTKRREGHYYRLHGQGFLVEYDNTQDGANHIHTVWRSPARDFGMDLLRAHAARAH